MTRGVSDVDAVDHSTFVFNNAAPQWLLILAVAWLLVSLLMTPSNRKARR